MKFMKMWKIGLVALAMMGTAQAEMYCWNDLDNPEVRVCGGQKAYDDYEFKKFVRAGMSEKQKADLRQSQRELEAAGREMTKGLFRELAKETRSLDTDTGYSFTDAFIKNVQKAVETMGQ